MLEDTRRKKAELARQRAQEEADIRQRDEQAAVEWQKELELSRARRAAATVVVPATTVVVEPSPLPPPPVQYYEQPRRSTPAPVIVDPTIVKTERTLDAQERSLEQLEKQELSKPNPNPDILKAFDDAIRAIQQDKLNIQTERGQVVAAGRQLRDW